MVIIATSDQHLGYEYSDKVSFNAFLDEISADKSVAHFVLLGDVVDMWRRDASGVFLENRDTFDKIASLTENGINVHYVAGNHDFHVMQLKKHAYPFEFVDHLLLSEEGRTYRFMHGYQFDPEQHEPLMEALCRTMADTMGSFESGVWSTLTRDWDDLSYFLSLFFKKRKVQMSTDRLQLTPEQRLIDSIDDVEQTACSRVQSGEILVFGHTHRPFINKRGTVVNTGSWVTDSPDHNTYARLEASGPRLFIFRQGEITKRVTG